jgi:imidazolonepropionase
MIRVYRKIKTAYTCRAAGAQSEIHPIERAAIVVEGEKIAWVGLEAELPAQFYGGEQVECGGAIAIPGLIDCHTHLCFAGWRAEEFEQRILGKSYAEIAAQGGGILSTVRKTRAASLPELVHRGLEFLREIAALGVTTVECKSGYGLSLEAELKLLRAYKELAQNQPLRIVPTFLGAHTVPEEFTADPQAYVQLVIDEMIPAVANQGLAKFCDVFVEKGAFSAEQGREVLLAGKAAGLLPKLHAEQFSACGGARLAAEVGAVSADHLEAVDQLGIDALREAEIIGVLLPLASLTTGVHPADGRRLLRSGLSLAIATDFNPGTAPSYHLPSALGLACLVNRIAPAEALKGATIIAAQAVGLAEQIGSIEAGKSADLAFIQADSINQWLSNPVPNFCQRTVCRGVEVYRA